MISDETSASLVLFLFKDNMKVSYTSPQFCGAYCDTRLIQIYYMTLYKKAMKSVASSIVYDFGKRHILCYKGLGLVASVGELHHT